MVGLVLLCLIAVAIAQEDDAAIHCQIDQLLLELRSLQGRVYQKESFILEQDQTILHLQRQLQGVKATQYKALLEKHEEELSTLRDKIQNLVLDRESLNFELQQLEGLSANQREQLDEAELALRLVKEQVMHVEEQADQKNTFFQKLFTRLLPYSAKKSFGHWQEMWASTVVNVWKRMVLVAGQWRRVLYKSRFFKTLVVLKEQIFTHIQRAQKCVEEKAHVISDACKTFVIKIARTLRSHLSQPNSILQPYFAKMNQHLNKGLKYGIKCHLQLQRRIRKTMQRNRYLASKESKEVIWFLASAVLIIPLYGALMLSSFVGERRRPSVAKAIVLQRRRHAVRLRLSER